ncbi:hypothetical protein, partial [Streptomyces sp. NPDC001675]
MTSWAVGAAAATAASGSGACAAFSAFGARSAFGAPAGAEARRLARRRERHGLANLIAYKHPPYNKGGQVVTLGGPSFKAT